MGLDTVELNGAPFDVKVKVGDSVTPETLLSLMDLNEVLDAGKKTDVVVAFTNTEKIAGFTLNKTGEIAQQTKIGEVEVVE